MNQLQNQNHCYIHSKPIISKNDNNDDQCKSCLEKECLNKMIEIEQASKEYKDILNSSRDNDEIILMQEVIEMINKNKEALLQSFNNKKDQQELFQDNNLQDQI